MSTRAKSPPLAVGGIVYVLMLVGAVSAFFLVRWYGEGLTAPEVPAGAVSVAAPKAGQVDVVAHVLATLAAVIGLGFVLGRLLKRVGQPPVIGEVLAGICLGPSLLGAISPEAMHWFVPSANADPKGQVLAALSAISQLGIVLYMFLIGLEMNGAHFRDHARSTVAIAHAGIAIPFAFGAGVALWLYPHFSSRDVPFTGFALYLAVSFSVTGFTVLTRILADTGRDKTRVGTTALGCAATDDVTVWCLVALATGVVQAEVGGAVWTVALAVGFIIGMFVVVRPLAKSLAASQFAASPAAIPCLFVAVLLSALATEAIGIHALIGAFLLGAVIPHDSRLAKEISRRLKDVVTVLLLPAFFAMMGLRTEFGLLGDAQSWLICGAILIVATLGKFGGVFAAARLSGHDPRTAAALGAMMNTRGLMALIVLDIGLNMGVISPTLFAMMVVMALATTLATAPALQWLVPTTHITQPSSAVATAELEDDSVHRVSR